MKRLLLITLLLAAALLYQIMYNPAAAQTAESATPAAPPSPETDPAIAAAAAKEPMAIASPKCGKDKIRQLAGDGLTKIEPAPWPDSYNVVLDSSKLSYGQLSQKMMEAGCM